jgi:hypothetical protein
MTTPVSAVSIGQHVWFHPHSQAARRGDRDYPLAAIVVFPHEDGTVNLVAFDQNGVPSGEHRVPIWDGEGDRPLADFAEAITDEKIKAAKPSRLKDEKDEDFHKRVEAWRKAEREKAEALKKKRADEAAKAAGMPAAGEPARALGEDDASYRARVETWRAAESPPEKYDGEDDAAFRRRAEAWRMEQSKRPPNWTEPSEPKRVFGEDDRVYRDRVDTWRREEQAKVAAAHADEAKAQAAQEKRVAADQAKKAEQAVRDAGFPARAPGESDEQFTARIEAWRKAAHLDRSEPAPAG